MKMNTFMNGTIFNNGSTNTGTTHYKTTIVGFFGSTLPDFRQCRTVRIIFQFNLSMESIF